MPLTREQPAYDRRRGDGSFVTLLFVAGLPLAAAVFALTQAFLAPADTAAAFVPANAVAYVHASGRAAANAVLSSSVQMPSGIAPDEVAVFATPGDDAMRWGAIVSWRPHRLPSADERAALDARDAVILDRRHYLIGDDSLAVSARVSAAAHSALADDRAKRHALALMRSVADVQAYAEPAAFLAPETASALGEVSSDAVGPLVAGINLMPSSVRLRLLPLTEAADAWSPLGYREPSVRGGRSAELARFPAQVAIAEETPSFDLARLFADVPRVEDHPSPLLLGRAGDELRASLARPYMLWLRPEEDRIAYLLRFPDAGTPAVKQALARYAAAIEPERTTLRLPDGDVVTEFLLGETPRAAEFGTDDAAIALGPSAGDTVAIGNDGTGGTLIGSSGAIVAEFRKNTAPHGGSTGACPTSTLRSAIVLHEPASLMSGVPQIKDAIDLLSLKEIVIGSSVGNGITICGYKY